MLPIRKMWQILSEYLLKVALFFLVALGMMLLLALEVSLL